MVEYRRRNQTRDRDSRMTSGGAPEVGPAQAWTGRAVGVACAEVGMHPGHEPGQGAAAMVPSDVGMQVQPHALDAVSLGAVERQEVKHDASTELLEGLAGLLAGMDGGVVQGEVDAAHVSVLARQAPKQLDEKGTGLGPASTYVSLSVRTFSAPTRKRFWLLPGVPPGAVRACTPPGISTRGVDGGASTLARALNNGHCRLAPGANRGEHLAHGRHGRRGEALGPGAPDTATPSSRWACTNPNPPACRPTLARASLGISRLPWEGRWPLACLAAPGVRPLGSAARHRRRWRWHSPVLARRRCMMPLSPRRPPPFTFER